MEFKIVSLRLFPPSITVILGSVKSYSFITSLVLLTHSFGEDTIISSISSTFKKASRECIKIGLPAIK